MKRCRFCALASCKLVETHWGYLICTGISGFKRLPDWARNGRCPVFISGGLLPESYIETLPPYYIGDFNKSGKNIDMRFEYKEIE